MCYQSKLFNGCTLLVAAITRSIFGRMNFVADICEVKEFSGNTRDEIRGV